MRLILLAFLIFSFHPGIVFARESKNLENGDKSIVVKPEDFEGKNISEKISNALGFLEECNGGTILFKDTAVYLITEAIALPSNTTMVVDGCKIKLADQTFDNIIRSGNLDIDEQNPNSYVKQLLPAKNIRITGKNGAVIEGAENFYEGVNPKTGVREKWLGDYWGWRNFTILFSYVDGFEISGLKVQKTHSWGIVLTNGCKNGHVNNLELHTTVKNGDGISVIQGGSDILIENITGETSDDSIILAAFDESRWSNNKYVFPLLPVSYSDYSYGGDIHDITCRNIETSGIHHVMILLPSQPKIYNIYCSNISDGPKGGKRKVIRIYGNGQYGQGFKPGNMYNIYMNGILSYKADIALEFLAPVHNSHFNKIIQLNPVGKDIQTDPENVNVRVTNTVKK
ncbi:glycoside hydrolase family protein [Dysgonomonas termitidis]|uniref:Pectate lyase superfamily protein domain-containing protein n=1 Tax=Dysgonomonas termitidis TaxID=1516126 RepID=A0ABV9KWQ2_9BACT